VDIESLLGSRKPGDLPKVVTKYIFGNTGPPAVKVRKLGVMPPKLGNYSTSLLRYGESVTGSGSTFEFDEAHWIQTNRPGRSDATVMGRTNESNNPLPEDDITIPLRKVILQHYSYHNHCECELLSDWSRHRFLTLNTCFFIVYSEIFLESYLGMVLLECLHSLN